MCAYAYVYAMGMCMDMSYVYLCVYIFLREATAALDAINKGMAHPVWAVENSRHQTEQATAFAEKERADPRQSPPDEPRQPGHLANDQII